MRNRLFDSIKVKAPRHNTFDLSHEKKLSCNMGELVPIYCQEVLPSDFYQGRSELVIRFAPMTAPVMHRINAFVHYFFVPNRLVWDNWKKFITGGEDGLQAPELPYLVYDESTRGNFKAGMLADYMGVVPSDLLPVNMDIFTKINALPFKAYALIWNEYYRDQNLQTAVDINPGVDGVQSQAFTTLRYRGYEKDYFTSSLPWTQRGNDVNIPMDIQYGGALVRDVVTGNLASTGNIQSAAGGELTVPPSGNRGTIENIDSIGATINDLRTSVRLQEYLEKMARAGSRYVEQIMALFGVQSDDLQQSRPQYLGGGKIPIQISEVLATFENTDTMLGQMAGHGIGVASTPSFSGSFKEHGYIIGIMSTLPRTAYFQGVDRHLLKEDRFDYFTPDFAHLGEQPVLNKELYFTGKAIDDPIGVFGYQSRYSEYKFNKSSIHGDFATTLDYWHLGRKFASLPALNGSFITALPDMRIFAVEDESDKLWIQLYNSIRGSRPIPVYGTPRL